MPGFDVLTTQLAKSGLICPECSLLVKEAVQTPEGVRLCKSCYDELARYNIFILEVRMRRDSLHFTLTFTVGSRAL